MNDPSTIRRLYGRRQGHKLRQGQAELVEATLSALSVPATGPLDARALFGVDRPLQLEIGFGAGEHLTAQAEAYPASGFIGCEPFLNGVVAALGHIRDRGLDNVRLHMGDALDVVERLPDASLERVYLLHRSLAESAPRQAPHGQPRSARRDRRQAQAGRRVPPRHRRPDLCRWRRW